MDTKLDILIVDDIKDNLLALSSLLGRSDVRICQAMSGEEALELMMKHDFCLALLDIQMPGMNGFELAELMRGSNKTKTIPIIFVTAAGNDERYLFKGYESGAVDFLRKPLDTHAVKSKVNVFIQLHQQKKELQKQVTELKLIREELELAVRVREEFMSIAGHELKTPLTSLKLQTQMRKRNMENDRADLFTTEKLSKMFDADNRQLEKLTRLIDDMLDVSRISSGNLSMNPESFDLCALLQEVVERNIGLFDFAACEVKTHYPDQLTGNWDRLRIEQVVTNILTNAIRYGAGQPIHIHIKSENDKAIIMIQDHGVGIEEEDLKRIFHRFERATLTEVNGLGLGLYIVSQIVEAHQGLINVESSPGQGSLFRVELPL